MRDGLSVPAQRVLGLRRGELSDFALIYLFGLFYPQTCEKKWRSVKIRKISGRM